MSGVTLANPDSRRAYVSRHWSSDINCADLKEVQASAMGVDASGRKALLGGRRVFALVDVADNTPLGKAKQSITPCITANARDFSSQKCQ